MAFKSNSVMEQKKEFVLFASRDDSNMSELCKRYKITRKTGYKWLYRYQTGGLEALEDKKRTPLSSPGKTSSEIEGRIIEIRNDNPEWGSKKIHKIISNENDYDPPAKSTINRVLNRHGLIKKEKSVQARSFQRFEYEYPNALWQMDYKGHFPLLNKERCYPLTILDDHSRFNIGLIACKNEQGTTVKNHLISVFRKYGLPEMILTDNGSPWGTAGYTEDGEKAYTLLEKWLMRNHVKLIHGRPYHPQTQGKEERFHRTLKAEVLQYEQFKDMDKCQQRFNGWRERYNTYRPHESLNFEVPQSRYKPSDIIYQEELPEIEYDSTDQIRKVMDKGFISFKKKSIRVGKAFKGDYVAIKPTTLDGIWDVYYCNQVIKRICLH